MYMNHGISTRHVEVTTSIYILCYQDLLHAKQHNKIMSMYWHDLCQNIQQRETEENNILFGFNI